MIRTNVVTHTQKLISSSKPAPSLAPGVEEVYLAIDARGNGRSTLVGLYLEEERGELAPVKLPFIRTSGAAIQAIFDRLALTSGADSWEAPRTLEELIGDGVIYPFGLAPEEVDTQAGALPLTVPTHIQKIQGPATSKGSPRDIWLVYQALGYEQARVIDVIEGSTIKADTEELTAQYESLRRLPTVRSNYTSYDVWLYYKELDLATIRTELSSRDAIKAAARRANEAIKQANKR